MSHPEVEPLYESFATVPDAFRAVAARHAESIALSSGSQQMSYRELDAASNRLSRTLISAGLRPGGIVAVVCGRRMEMVIAWLAILKAGGAYLPIDPDLPAPALNAILSVGRPAIVLAAGDCAATGFVALDAAIQTSQGESAAPPATDSSADDRGADAPAYVMFTSGTTGEPKGVIIPHRGILRLVLGQNYARLDASTVILQLAAPSFDASTFEVYGALLNGGRLECYEGALSLDRIASAVTERGVNTLWLTAGLFHLFVDHGIGALAGLHQLLAGGDVLSAQHLRIAAAALPDCQIINGYGPTENTTFTCCYPIPRAGWGQGPVPIGFPISGTTVHILDEAMIPVRQGESGHLWTGGEGVALGYIGSPDLTAERFKPDPFAGDGSLMYCTGDRARMREDGAIEFLGRADREIKVDGRRVNLNDVEAMLRAHERIEDAYVCVSDSGAAGKRLIAYVKPIAAAPGGFVEGLRRELALTHPSHALPHVFVAVDRFPLNANGKVDRQALLAEAARGVAASTEEPDQLPGSVAAIFREVLGTDAIDLGRNFFDIGLTSLMLARAHARIVAETGRNIDIAEFFACGSIGAVSRKLESGTHRSTAGLANDARERAQRQQAALKRIRRA